MISHLRFLLALFTILSCTTIASWAVQGTHGGVVFEKTCVFEGETHFWADFNAAKGTEQIGMAGDDVAIQFGKDANQVEHAFRHTDALGLDRGVVQSEVQAHLKTVASQITPGKPFNQVIEVGGQRMQYTAFKLQDGTINVGRIHGAP